MPIRGVLFDFGYTLFAHPTLGATITDCARQLGADVTPEQSATLADRIDAAAMAPAELVHPRDLDPAVWSQRWKVLYSVADEVAVGLADALFTSMHHPMAWAPYRDTATTLTELHDQGVAIGIVSNTGWDVRAVFVSNALASLVTSFTLSYEAGAVKPDPRIFAAGCESISVAAEHVLMVGDDPRSDGGAIAAGIRTLLLPPRPPGTDNGISAVVHLVAATSDGV